MTGRVPDGDLPARGVQQTFQAQSACQVKKIITIVSFFDFCCPIVSSILFLARMKEKLYLCNGKVGWRLPLGFCGITTDRE